MSINEFMYYFDVPAHLEKVVAEEFKKYCDQEF